MRATCHFLLRRAITASAPLSAAVPPNYSNIPYQKRNTKVDDDEDDDGCGCQHRKKDSTQFTSSMAGSGLSSMRPMAKLEAVLPPPPPPMRSTFISPSRTVTSFNSNYKIHSFRHTVCGASDLSMRPLQFLDFTATAHLGANGGPGRTHDERAKSKAIQEANSFGERLRDSLSCRWAAKFYGKVTYGPRNYPYPSSRWLARRFKMKKHKIVKRFRFRRYKLAAVANLPFAKMIRVGMLPELKSSKTKKGDAVDAGLSAQLVSAAKSATGGKVKGKRSRPKSKYQV